MSYDDEDPETQKALDEYGAYCRADERARIVAWLRGPENKAWAGIAKEHADAIERGEHLK